MQKIIWGLGTAIWLIVGASGVSGQTTNGFRIIGQLKNEKAGWVYLVYARDGRQVVDSIRIDNGAYAFSGEVKEGQSAFLLDVSPIGTRPPAADIAEFYLMPGSVKVTHADSFSDVSFTGSQANTDFKTLMDEMKPYKERENALKPRYMAAKTAKDDAAVRIIEEQSKSIQKELGVNVYGSFVRLHPNSQVSLFVLKSYAQSDVDVQKLLSLFDGLGSVTRESEEGKTFRKKLVIVAKTNVGNEAMDFTQNDTAGKPIKLSSFRGRYVLLDFWASWCLPCRGENPNVVKVYAKYHAKGFDIISVSLDRPGDKDKWLKAIHDDQLTWTQVSDLQFWNNAVAKEYGINSIPRNFLIDPKGRIIAEGLRGEDLGKKLAEIYK